MATSTRAAIIISFILCFLAALMGLGPWIIIIFAAIYTILGTLHILYKGHRWYNDLPNSLRVTLGAIGGWILIINPIIGILLLILGFLLNDEPLRRVWRGAGIIVLSGVDGTGKTTWANRICEWITEKGHKCHIIHFHKYLILSRIRQAPSTKGLSKTPPRKRSRFYFIRPYLALLDNLFLYLIKIMPAVWRGEYVICDRFIWDNYIKHKALGYKMWRWGSLLVQPKQGFILDVNPNISRQRTDSRDFHYEYTFHELEEERKDFRQIGRQLGYTIISTEQSTSKTWNEIMKALAAGELARLFKNN